VAECRSRPACATLLFAAPVRRLLLERFVLLREFLGLTGAPRSAMIYPGGLQLLIGGARRAFWSEAFGEIDDQMHTEAMTRYYHLHDQLKKRRGSPEVGHPKCFVGCDANESGGHRPEQRHPCATNRATKPSRSSARRSGGKQEDANPNHEPVAKMKISHDRPPDVWGARDTGVLLGERRTSQDAHGSVHSSLVKGNGRSAYGKFRAVVRPSCDQQAAGPKLTHQSRPDIVPTGSDINATLRKRIRSQNPVADSQ